MLGTALKIVAGTPDFDDWEQIKFRQTQLTDSENRHIELNTSFQTRLNEQTEIVNSISKTDEIDSNLLYKTIKQQSYDYLRLTELNTWRKTFKNKPETTLMLRR